MIARVDRAPSRPQATDRLALATERAHDAEMARARADAEVAAARAHAVDRTATSGAELAQARRA